MKKLLFAFLGILTVAGVFELLFWIHSLLGANIPIDFTGVNTLTVWAAVLTVVFVVFSILGLLNIDNRIKELNDLKNEVSETNSRMREQLTEIKRSAEEERQKIVKKAQEQVIKIMDKSAQRQNLFDRLTQIAGIPDPVARIKNYTEILKNKTTADGVNICFILCRRGEAFQELKRDEEAMRDFNEAIKVAPENPEGYIVAGYFMVHRKEDYKESIRYFEKALELAPTNASLYSNIANSYGKLGDFTKAEEYYTKARDYNVEAAEWYFNKAVTIRNDGSPDPNHDIEEGYLKHSLRLNPMFFPSALNLVRIYQERGDLKTAHKHLTDLINQGVNHEYFKAVIQRGVTMLSMDYPGIALADFQWAYNLYPYDLFVIANICTCHMNCGYISIAAQYASRGLMIATDTDNHQFDKIFTDVLDIFNNIKPIMTTTASSRNQSAK